MQERKLEAMRHAAISTVLVLMVTLPACSFVGRHDSDADIRALFEEKRQMFERLVEMMLEDEHLVRVSDDCVFTKTGSYCMGYENSLPEISAERWVEYRTLFKEAELMSGVTRPVPSDTIFFAITNRGLATSGSDKGIAYSTVRLTSTASLDAVEANFPSLRGEAYHHMGDAWYVYLRWNLG